MGCYRYVVDPHWRHRVAECFQWLVRLMVCISKQNRNERRVEGIGWSRRRVVKKGRKKGVRMKRRYVQFEG